MSDKMSIPVALVAILATATIISCIAMIVLGPPKQLIINYPEEIVIAEKGDLLMVESVDTIKSKQYITIGFYGKNKHLNH